MIDWKQMPHGRERYHAYLASREWAKLKVKIRKRSAGMCEACYVAAATETHHQTYIRLYREHLDDLRHVCHECHLYLSAASDFNPADERFFTPELANCIKCAAVIRDPIGRNDKGEWFCEDCALDADAQRRGESLKAGAA